MKVILYVTSTINGYIAKEDGDCPWSDVVWQEYYKFIKEQKNIIVGRKTYEIMNEVGEFEKLGNPFTVVVSSGMKVGDDKINFVSSPGQAVELLSDKGFNEVVIGGGSSLITSFLKVNLVDEIQLFVEPKIIGSGIKFVESGIGEVDLELVSTEKLSDSVLKIVYKVKNNLNLK
jgi:dihydrofolate reductase